MGIKDRLGRLERGRCGSCAECGHGYPAAAYDVVWEDGWEEEYGEEPAEPMGDCPRCGRPLEIVITWGDDEEEGAWGT